MIQFTTHNSESQIAIGVQKLDSDFTLEQNKLHVWFLKKKTYGNHTMFVPLTKVKDPIILGTFNKEKNEIDFEVDFDWIWSDELPKNDDGDTITPKGVNIFDYFKSLYLELLRSVTKESKENKFLIIKQIEK